MNVVDVVRCVRLCRDDELADITRTFTDFNSMVCNDSDVPYSKRNNQHKCMNDKYAREMWDLRGAVVEINPCYKKQVGDAIFKYVKDLVGNRAPLVVGHMIELPIERI